MLAPPSCVYVAITLYGVSFQTTLTFQVRNLTHGPKHHISSAFQQRIQFALCCFHSLLLTASQLISFPAGTKTFQFPAFPFITELMRSLIRVSPVQRPRASRRSIL